jgi:hypothetical protein
MFIISAGEGSALSWGPSPRGQRPAPSLSDRGEGHSPSVALAAAACLALRPKRLRRCFRCHLPPRQPKEVSPPTRLSAPPADSPPTLRPSCMSSPLEWGRGRGPCRSSVCPEVIAAVVWPSGAEVVVTAAGAGGGEPPGVSSPRRPSNVGVVRTCGGGTGVPFVIAP